MLPKAYVVDDEPLAVQRLTRLLENTGRVEIAGSTTDPDMALNFLRSHKVDVVFLDIQMPGFTGFQLLEQLDTDPFVIFTTAYDSYAIEAFKVNSIDYLLKPVETDALDRALDKLQKRTSGGSIDGDLAAIRTLVQELAVRRPDGQRLTRLASRIGERTTILDAARVTHFVARDKLTFAVANGREHVVDYTLTELEGKLERRFVRIHRATIVNIAFVQELFPSVDGGLIVRLKDEARTELAVARDRVRELKGRLGI